MALYWRCGVVVVCAVVLLMMQYMLNSSFYRASHIGQLSDSLFSFNSSVLYSGSKLPMFNYSIEENTSQSAKPRDPKVDKMISNALKYPRLPKALQDKIRTGEIVGVNVPEEFLDALSNDSDPVVISRSVPGKATDNAVPKRNSPGGNQCPLVPLQLQGLSKVKTSAPSFPELEKQHPELEGGGRWFPKDCVARHKVAIIVPFRDREEHLRVFLQQMHPILQRQQLDYGIYIVEQAGSGKFNRGMLLNVGFRESMKLYDYSCIVFHDVDLLPEDDRNLYGCPDQPRHMSVAIDTMSYRLPYADIFGGVGAMKKEHFIKVNGFSNRFWGWGGEDDDLANRIKFSGLHISRYPATIARYHMMSHKKDKPNPKRYEVLFSGKKRFKTDGLSNLNYKVKDLLLKRLYTWIYVSFPS